MVRKAAMSRRSCDDGEKELSKKERIKNVIDTLRLILFVESCYGIFRCRVTHDGVKQTNKKFKLISIVIPSIYVVMFILFLRLPDAIFGSTKLADAIDELPSIVTITQYVAAAFKISFLISESHIRLFELFADIDLRLHIDTDRSFYEKSRRVTILCLIILLLVHTMVAAFDLLSDDKTITVSRIIVLPIYLEKNLEQCTFCLFIWMLATRLTVINKNLTLFIEKRTKKSSIFLVKDELDTENEEDNLIGHPSPDNKKVRDLALTYDLIGETCGLISNIFNFQICMALISTFTYVVTTIWTSIYYYRNHDDLDSLLTINIWCLAAISVVVLLSLTCERLLSIKNETKLLVNQLIMDYELPKSMRVQAKAFMELIEAWPLRIFIYDMFSVDITLMLKFISVATTYLIVIVQITHFL